MTARALLSLPVGLALVAAGCGGAPAHDASEASGAVAFSACMRHHGVPAYPDPAVAGRLPKEPLQQLGVAASTFERAQRSCIHLVPDGGAPSPAQVAQYRSAMLGYARCIRSHGVPRMPDPDSRGHLDIGPGSGVDVNSPQFEAAYRACRSRLAP